MQEHRADMLSERSWEETLDFLTADMDTENIDICELADRYRSYIKELQSHDLEVSARAIRVLSALLRMKSQAMYFEEQEQQEEDPMDFDEEIESSGREPDLEAAPDLELPVRNEPSRRMDKSELKESLREALEVREQRQERQRRREEIDQQFEVEEQTLRDRLDSLYSRITGFISSSSEEVKFSSLVDPEDPEEKIERFKHVLNLENEDRVDLIQEEFLGDLKVAPKEED
jgi:chromatin segregation and condensation protein Rec8/ScpA/Scc1 (kleisin family)